MVKIKRFADEDASLRGRAHLRTAWRTAVLRAYYLAPDDCPGSAESRRRWTRRELRRCAGLVFIEGGVCRGSRAVAPPPHPRSTSSSLSLQRNKHTQAFAPSLGSAVRATVSSDGRRGTSSMWMVQELVGNTRYALLVRLRYPHPSIPSIPWRVRQGDATTLSMDLNNVRVH